MSFNLFKLSEIKLLKVDKKLGKNKTSSSYHFPLSTLRNLNRQNNYAQKWQQRDQREVNITEYEPEVISWWRIDSGLVMSFKCSETLLSNES